MQSHLRIGRKANSIFQSICNICKIQMSAERDEKRRIVRFCGLIHVRTLAIILAIVEIFFLLYQALVAISYILSSSSSHHVVSATIYTLAVVIAWIAVFLLLIGIFRQNPILLLPHMLMQILLVLMMLSMASFALYALLVGTSVQLRYTIVGMSLDGIVKPLPTTAAYNISTISQFLTGLVVLVTVCYVIAALINVWCFHVVMDCYRWQYVCLEEKSRVLSSPQEGDLVIPRTPDSKPFSVIHATDF